MVDLRPVGYVIGLIIAALGLTMIVPLLTDFLLGDANAGAFAEASLISVTAGGFTAIACQNRAGRSLSVRQAFLLTLGIWMFVPFFGALPFLIGAPDVRFIDAYFEAVSGITTTGASVFVGVDDLPAGVTLWRAMLNWLGGLGIAFIAMIFLPVMRVGGMQFFRTEGFDTFGKVLPRATDIARELFLVYALLTVGCMMAYAAAGMPTFEAVTHGMATIATGGFSPRGASFSGYAPQIQYTAVAFMILGSLPYVRYVQLLRGAMAPLRSDLQVRTYLMWIAIAVMGVTAWRLATSDQSAEPAFRETLFNLVSIISCTGFGAGDFSAWGAFPATVALWLGIMGACSGSSSAGLSVFRVQVMFSLLSARVRQIQMPHQIIALRYGGQPIEADTVDAIMLFVGAYVVTLGVFSVLIAASGVDFESALFTSWTAMANIGYGYGAILGDTGTHVALPDTAKILMILAMIMGRLSLLSVLVILLPRFWQD
ncbi:MAG: potassium transporter TrkH [Rhodobacterales bacterium 32-67-9]|nr:MAG: potassium transporter TrkH [Rhodobacterales bacterium 32-67-9]